LQTSSLRSASMRSLLLAALALFSAPAYAADLSSQYTVPSGGGQSTASATVILCPSSDGSVSAVACTFSGGGSGGNVNLFQVNGATISLGQTTAALSLPVTIASNQTTFPVTASQGAGASGSPWYTVTTSSGLAAVGIAPTSSTAIESGHVLKAGAGNLYWVGVTTAATAGLLMIFDSATVPADGAVVPKFCIQVPASGNGSFAPPVPAVFASGISVAFSTGTSCVTKAASVTAFFSAEVK
jgi:hypothetical protein